MLNAERLKNDPRVHQGQALLLEAISEHTDAIKGIKPADPERKIAYEELLQAISKERGAHLYFPYVGSGLGKGALVELLDGSIKYDMITGIGVHFFGHSHPAIVSSSIEAALTDTVMQGNLQQNIEGHELASLLIEHSGLPHCFISTSGVMANENALKIAFQKNAPANRILAFDHCFAGRTLTFSHVTDKPAYREGLPASIPVDYIPFFDPDRPEESTEEAKIELLKFIKRYPKSHAIMIFELVQGEGGFYVGSKQFFEVLMQVCKEHHIAVFADEIQTFARTSALFAFQHFELTQYIDIAAIGKLAQVAATLYSDEYCPRPGLLSQTFTGSTSALKAGTTLIQHLLKTNYFGKDGRNLAIHKRFMEHFKRIEEKHPGLIQGPYGIGCMIAFTPFNGTFEKTTQLIHALFDAGVITFIAGSHTFRVRMLVPGAIISDVEIDAVMSLIESTLLKVAGNAPR